MQSLPALVSQMIIPVANQMQPVLPIINTAIFSANFTRSTQVIIRPSSGPTQITGQPTP